MLADSDRCSARPWAVSLAVVKHRCARAVTTGTGGEAGGTGERLAARDRRPAPGRLVDASPSSSDRSHCSSADSRSLRMHRCGRAASSVGQLDGGGERLARRDDAVDEPDALGLRRRRRPDRSGSGRSPGCGRSAAAGGPCRGRRAARRSAGSRRRAWHPTAATRRSHHSASSRPPATAGPSMAAIDRLAEAQPGRPHRTRTVVADGTPIARRRAP